MYYYWHLNIFLGVCEGSGTSHYTTFDKVDFTHKQNCSHVLVKTTKENDSLKPGFTVCFF